jgi:WD40 repeat protein
VPRATPIRRRSLLWEGRREAALRLEQDGNGFEALPKLLANIADQQRAERDDAVVMERQRIGVLVGQGARLIDRFVIADANPLSVAVSPNGEVLAIALNDQSVRWYDTRTLEERGRVSLAGKDKPGRGTSAGVAAALPSTMRACLPPWSGSPTGSSPYDSSSWLIELGPGRLVDPPQRLRRIFRRHLQPQRPLRHLAQPERRSQVWSVDSGKPVSTLAPAGEDDLPWFMDPRGRYATFLSTGMRRIHIFTLPDMSAARHHRFSGKRRHLRPGHVERRQPAGARGFRGPRVRARTSSIAPCAPCPAPAAGRFPGSPSARTTAGMAAASSDGVVRTFDVATGDSLTSGDLGHDFKVERVAIRPRAAAGGSRQARAASRSGVCPCPVRKLRLRRVWDWVRRRMA